MFVERYMNGLKIVFVESVLRATPRAAAIYETHLSIKFSCFTEHEVLVGFCKAQKSLRLSAQRMGGSVHKRR